MPLRGVDATSGSLEWRCAACGETRAGYPLSGVVMYRNPLEPALEPALALICPRCSAIECFNTRLTAEDEDAHAPGNHAARAEQARLVRALCRMAGLAVRG